MSKENRDRLALRMGPETKRKIDQWYEAAGCHSRNQFVEQAVNFYADHLSVQSNGSLPIAVSSALDGRLGMFEDRLASLLYKHSVELDMVMGILADSYELTAEDMRRRRADSVRNVKQTNVGCLSNRRFALRMRRRTNGSADSQESVHQRRCAGGQLREVHWHT